MKPFQPKVRGWALVAWGTAVFLLAVGAVLWFFGDSHGSGKTGAYLLFAGMGLNLLSVALSRRDSTAGAGSRTP